MGMFDNIECNYPLPLSKELIELEDFNIYGVEFQTKSFENLMELYIITEEGELFRKKIDYKWVDDEEYFLKGYMKATKEELIKENYHGIIEFYCYEDIKKEVNGKIRETSISVDYIAKFSDGKIVSIDLVNQTIEDTTEHYEKMQSLFKEMKVQRNKWYNKYLLDTKQFKEFKRHCIYKPLQGLHNLTGKLLTLSYKL